MLLAWVPSDMAVLGVVVVGSLRLLESFLIRVALEKKVKDSETKTLFEAHNYRRLSEKNEK